MSASYVDDVTDEARRFGSRVTSLIEISKLMNGSAASAPNLARPKTELAKSVHDKAFLDAIEVYDAGDFKVYFKAIKELGALVNTKWSNTIQRMNLWSTESSYICKGHAGKKKNHLISEEYTTKSINVQNTLSDLEKLGFDTPRLKAVLEGDGDSYCDIDGRKNSWGGYAFHVTRSDSAMNDIKEELAPPLKVFKKLRENHALKILFAWNEDIGAGLTLGTVVQRMFELESKLSSFPAMDVPRLHGLVSESAMQNLIQLARPVETAQTITGHAKSALKVVVSNKRIAPVMDDLEKALAQMTEVADNVAYATSIADSIKTLNDLHVKMTTVSKVLTKFSRVTGADAQSASDTVHSLLPSSMLQPLDFSLLQVETHPEVARMQMCCNALREHLDRVKADPLLSDIKNARDNAITIIGELMKSVTDPMCNRPQLRQSIVMALKTYIKNVRRSIKRYEQKHSDFVMWSNRRGLEYMVKWASIPKGMKGKEGKPIVSEKEAELIDTYFETLQEIAADIGAMMNKAEEESLQIFTSGSYMAILNEDEGLLDSTQRDVEKFERYLVETRMKMARLYSSNGYSFMDVLRDPRTLVLYALKALRVLLIWAALAFAKGIFLPMYNNAVYVENNDPPNPIWFVVTFLAFDIGLNVALYVILLALQFLFKSKDNNFPINHNLLWAFVVDYALSTSLIAILAFIIGSIIKRKKYFRYRFEGDRGIRAMSDMVLWVSSGVLFIPYFRFMDV